MFRLVSLSAAALVLVAYTSAQRASDPVGTGASDVTAAAAEPEATAHLRDAQGNDVGTASLEQDEDGVEVEITVKGLPAGQHGVHFHAIGACTPPNFTSTGGHFNPHNRQHGLANPNGPHAGDLPNLMLDHDGKGEIEVTTNRITLNSGVNSVFDSDGTAVVIHARSDDQRTDPSGNAGPGIACGVVQRD